MANEINIRLDTTGLTVVAKVLAADGSQQGADVTLTETNKYYTGTYSWAGLPDGRYLVEFTRNDTGKLVGLGDVEIKDGAELTSPLLQTNLTAEHDATQAQIAALNNLSAADVQAELVTYDAATGTEIAALNDFDPATQEVNANIVKVNNLTVNGSGTAGDPWGP